MLYFGNILNFPAYYKKRQDSVRLVDSRITKIYLDDDKNLTVEGTAGKYSQIIKFQGGKVDMNTSIKCLCSCESFKFEFSAVLKKMDSLLNPSRFSDTPPKKKNTYMVESGCKHIIAFARQINKNQHKFLV